MPEIFTSSNQGNKGSSNANGASAGSVTDPDPRANPTMPSVSSTSTVSATSSHPTSPTNQAIDQFLAQHQANRNPFRAFAALPADTSFDFQLEQEQVLLLLRQHPVTQIKWILIAVVLILLPFLFGAVPLLTFLPIRFHFVALVGWYLMVIGFSLEAFLDWFYNVNIVTNERVVDVDFNSLLFKNISTAQIDRIEDISATTSGYLGSIFDFGDVTIQTAGAQEEFKFDKVPHPTQVSAFINELIVREEQEHLQGEL